MTFKDACKYPGNQPKCEYAEGIFQAYGLIFDITNSDPEKCIYVCGVDIVSTNPDLNFTWTRPANETNILCGAQAETNCVIVPAGATGEIFFFFNNAGDSANEVFTFTGTVTWSHNCPCSGDTHEHATIPISGSVDGTRPFGQCQCDAGFVPNA